MHTSSVLTIFDIRKFCIVLGCGLFTHDGYVIITASRAIPDTYQSHLTGLSLSFIILYVLGTVGFLAYLNQYTTIPVDSVLIFENVNLNLGNG